MSKTYYYFAATLPMITWGGKLTVTVEEFLEAAGRLLTPGDRALVERLMAGDDNAVTDNVAAREWIVFEHSLRNEAVAQRAKRAHKDATKYAREPNENDPWLRGVVEEASQMDDLLEGEKHLDRARWEFLDRLGAGHAFDLEAVIVYGLKLKIVQRHQDYQSPAGEEAFNGIKARELPIA